MNHPIHSSNPRPSSLPLRSTLPRSARSALIAAALLLTGAASNAHAALIFSEPFDYTPVGASLGSNGYTVTLGGSQINSSTGAYVGANQTVAGQTSTANGARLRVQGNGDGISVTASKSISGLGAAADTLYYAAMLNPTSLVGDRATPTYMQVQFGFTGATQSNLVLRVEHDQDDNRTSNGPYDFRAGFSTADNGGGMTILGNNLAANVARFLVVKQTKSGSTYTFQAALNPATTGENNVTWTNIGSFIDADGFSFNSLSLKLKTPTDDNPAAEGVIDEIRIGTLFSDVAAAPPSTVATTYTLSTSQASTLNLLKGGSTSAGNSTITNNGGAGKDTLNFTNLSASSNNANTSVAGTLAPGGPLANSNGSASQALTVTGNAYGTSTITSTVATATNATLGGNATQSGASGSFSVNVGSATVGGPALTAAVSASGSLAGLASRTTQGQFGALGNEAEIAAGTNSAGTDTVSMQWRLRTNGETYPNDPPVLSDVVNLTGITAGDLFVLKIYYKASDIPVTINESTLALGWNDIGVDGWENAVLGNSDLGASAQRLNGAWTVIGALDPTDLGKYGVDTTDVTYNGISYGGYVWAVVNHNSEFAVIPEPASLSLLALGTLALATKRRRPSNP